MAISLRWGWQKDHLHPAGSGNPSATTNTVILPHRSTDSSCFALSTTILLCHLNHSVVLRHLNHSVVLYNPKYSVVFFSITTFKPFCSIYAMQTILQYVDNVLDSAQGTVRESSLFLL